MKDGARGPPVITILEVLYIYISKLFYYYEDVGQFYVVELSMRLCIAFNLL